MIVCQEIVDKNSMNASVILPCLVPVLGLGFLGFKNKLFYGKFIKVKHSVRDSILPLIFCNRMFFTGRV